jgi:hypothetical protein
MRANLKSGSMRGGWRGDRARPVANSTIRPNVGATLSVEHGGYRPEMLSKNSAASWRVARGYW